MECTDCGTFILWDWDGMCRECYDAYHEEIMSQDCLEDSLDMLLEEV
jgi:hypothetical protein